MIHHSINLPHMRATNSRLQNPFWALRFPCLLAWHILLASIKSVHSPTRQPHHLLPHWYINVVHGKFTRHTSRCMVCFTKYGLPGLADCRTPWNIIYAFEFALLSSIRAATCNCKPMLDQHHLSFHNLQTTQTYVAYHASFLGCLKVL